MKSDYKRLLRLMLLGLTGAGKSRLGNKLSGNVNFIESDGSDSCTKKVQRAINQFGVEIIDSQGLADTNKEDKDGLISIFSEIKEKRPNVLAYVQNASDKRFGEASEKAILEICKMFDTKSVWNHFIIVFTFAGTVSQKNRENRAKNFSESILKVLREYYAKNKLNDNLPIPNNLRYYFVELGDDDEYKLDANTVNSLTDIMKLIELMPPISNTREKIIVEIKTKRNCQESIKKYDRMVKDEYGTAKEIAAFIGLGTGIGAIDSGAATVAVGALVSAGVMATAPIILIGAAAGGIVSYFCGEKLVEKIGKLDFQEKVDDNYQNEDYITFDEETYVYHDGTTEVKRINVENFTRIISK